MNKTVIQTALRTLEIERDTLDALRQSINANFVAAAMCIYQTKGRVIVTGIGKSAVVAQKLVATFNSTGTPSVFMHAADAIHGDLGIIQRDDVVICLSKSGDTAEIKILVPLLKRFGSTLIGIVANVQSYLAVQADYVIHTPVEKEADPNNLAPTASTTAQMAMGDALAMSLLAMRGFTAADFAQFHPGGALGKQLYLRVQDIYIQHGTPSVARSTNLKNTIIEMTAQRLGATAVVDENRYLLGIITDGDLRRLLTKDIDLNNITAEAIMTTHPKTIEPEALAVEALKIMRESSITQLVVTEGGKYLGMVHLHDLLKEGIV